MDVYRYFIADALFMALKKNKRQSINSTGGFQVYSERLLCPCTSNGPKGRKRFIMTITLIISMAN